MSKYLDMSIDDDCISVITRAESMLSWHSAVESLSKESLCNLSFYSAKDMRRLMAKAEDRCMKLKENIKSASCISIIEVTATTSPTAIEISEAAIPHLSVEDCPLTEEAVAAKLAASHRRRPSQLVRAATSSLFTTSRPTTPSHSRSNTLTVPGTPTSKRFSFDVHSLHHAGSRQALRIHQDDTISEFGQFNTHTSYPTSTDSEQSTPRASTSSTRLRISFARRSSCNYSTFPQSFGASSSAPPTSLDGSRTLLLDSTADEIVFGTTNTPISQDDQEKRPALSRKFNTMPAGSSKRRSLCGWVNKYMLCGMMKARCPEWERKDMDNAVTYVYDGEGWLPECDLDEKRSIVEKSCMISSIA